MYKDEYDRKQSKDDVDQPRDKNANSGAIKAFHRYQLLLLLLQLHLCYLYHAHTSISLHPAVHQLTTAMLQTKYISLCLQHLAVNVMDRYGICPCMWYILQLLTQWQHQYGQHTYQHSSLSANIPVCNTLLTEEIMPICKIYIYALRSSHHLFTCKILTAAHYLPLEALTLQMLQTTGHSNRSCDLVTSQTFEQYSNNFSDTHDHMYM